MVKKTLKLWRWTILMILVTIVMQVVGQSATTRGPRWPRYCTVQKKYNLTKRVKYRAPTAIRTYEWCLNFPPRCSKWTTEMRELTRLETEERVAEVEVCCPGYKYGPQGECEPFCGPGKTGQNCDEDCEPRYYGASCSHFCDPKECVHGICKHENGVCSCDQGWEGRSCNLSVPTTTTTTIVPTTTSSIFTTSAPITTISTTPLSTTASSTTIFTKPPTSYTYRPLLARAKTNNKTASTKTISTEHPISEKPITSTKPTLQSVIEDVSKKNIADNNLFKKHTEVTEASSNNYIDASTLKRTELPLTTPVTKSTIGIMNTKSTSIPTTKERTSTNTSVINSRLNVSQTITEEIKNTKITETTRKPAVTNKHISTTKFKPKEIWIRPAQKGDTPIVDLKIKPTQDIQYKHKTPIALTPSENSTTKTIIVSIIPTSVSASFKKIALSTASYVTPKANISTKSSKIPINGFTKPMIAQTTTPKPYTTPTNEFTRPVTTQSMTYITMKPDLTTLYKTERIEPIIQTLNKSRPVMATPLSTTNRMSTSTETLIRLNSSNPIIKVSVSSNISKTTESPSVTTTEMMGITTSTSRNNPSITKKHIEIDRYESTRKVTIAQDKATVFNETKITVKPNITNLNNKQVNDTNMKSLTNSYTNTVTENSAKNAETFNILTEPEHITAVMSDKEDARSSLDLISVISIVGGVMMAIITVAVVIVMLERCRRPRYDDVRKYNDVSMNVIIDNRDVPPPPYVRSIFHTPLPEPPISEKCHYQPISTLDRNLKQFMRPVVVQTISPIMLENFRGILECHYDHLPRRNHERHVGSPTTPSTDERCELLPQQRRHSVSELTIEALKCEAKMDVIDHTTSEPLYAEIPCWKPPLEHAVEVVNLNGEAVTEL